MTKTICVSVISSGTHKFDLGLLRRQGAEDLVETLLEKAGVIEGNWRLRVDEKKTCTGFTPPLSVQSFKPWCVYIRIKPGDNNTCHNCSLLLPNKSPQQYAQTLYNKLKEVLDSVNSSWKPSLERKAAMTAVDEPVEPKVTFQEEHEVTPKPEAPEFSSKQILRNPEFSSKQILRNPEQVHKVLLVVHKLSLLDFIKNQVQFMDAFRAEMGWQDFSKHATGSVIASLARRGYVARILSGKTIIGYALNEKGKQLIPDFVETQKSIPSINTAKIIRSLGNTGEWLLNSAKRLAVIEEEEELCKLQLSALEEEKRNICSKVNPETQLLLQQLSQTLKD